MQLVVTIYEETPEAALAAIHSVGADHDMIEIRVDRFCQPYDLRAFRAATEKPIIATNRGGPPVRIDGSGVDFVDVEFGSPVEQPERTILSVHDFERVPDLDPLLDAMLAHRCAHTKVAVTPRTLYENESILATLQRRRGVTLFGMGERGLYSRILAPFFGSELAFVSVNQSRSAAPGQLTLESAVAIYGRPPLQRPEKIFAVAGNPAGHSLSPTIHNPLFRERGVAGAYTIASFESFHQIAKSFQEGRIAGLSVTAPFKDDALAFAEQIAADITPNAREARAVNSLVATRRGVIADNTDVDGFELLLNGIRARRAAVVGAGGTSRAAQVALRRAGMQVTVYNRTPKGGTEPLDALLRFDGEIIINTLPAGVEVRMPQVPTYIEAAYSGTRTTDSGRRLLEAQAIRQNELFLEAFR